MLRDMYTPRFVLLSAIALIGFSSNGLAQDNPIKPFEMGALPIEVDESSGLAMATETSLWTHNDRGGKAEFYEVDVRGELLRTVKLTGVDAVDMEDMAIDQEGEVLYFADTGNNKQDRDELQIFIVNLNEIRDDAVKPGVITFDLPDKGLDSECHYDFEAMVFHNDKLYLFSKDRCDEADNSLMLYSLDTEAGEQEANFEGEFFWDDPEEVIKITSADITPDGKKLVLLSKDALHFFYAYSKDSFFDGAYHFQEIEKGKKEAVAHMTDCELFITEESTKGKAGKIWKLNVCKLKFY